MKKVAAILLVKMYLVLTIGAVISMQYCCGELTSFEFYAQADSCCGTEDEEPGCCDRELLIIQFDEPFAIHAVNAFKLLPASFDIVEAEVWHGAGEPAKNSMPGTNPVFCPPAKIPLWLSACSLVYYG